MHWGTAILSLETIWNLQLDLKQMLKSWLQKEDAIIFKIGEIKKLEDLIN